MGLFGGSKKDADKPKPTVGDSTERAFIAPGAQSPPKGGPPMPTAPPPRAPLSRAGGSSAAELNATPPPSDAEESGVYGPGFVAPPTQFMNDATPAMTPSQLPPRQPRMLSAPRPSSMSAPTRLSIDLRSLLAEAVRVGASDLHITRNMPPIIRLDGYLQPLEGPPMTEEQCSRIILGILTTEQRARFEREWELDLSLEYADIGRFRVNIHKQRGNVEAAFRIVNDVIVPIRKLGIPPIVEDLARKNSGLVVVTGPTGSGKTTTLAAIVDQINHERQAMIVTVEDPIEYVHRNHRAIIKQREITSDTHSFTAALRHVLRQDPDVIVVGEMRDLETISTALTAAETGHMIYTTLHTPDAIQTIDRIVDVFPPHQQEQTRIQLANTLQGVLAQQLIPVPGNRGRVVAAEVLIATTAVRKIIRTAKSEQLMTIIQTSTEFGMVTMDKSLKDLYQQGLISYEDAITRSKNPENFDNI